MSDGQISVSPDWLEAHGNALIQKGREIQFFMLELHEWVKTSDPSNGGGDDVGLYLGVQYFKGAGLLLDATDMAGEALIVRGGDVVAVADQSREAEQSRANSSTDQ
jgi:hypothetical protein